MKRLAFIIVIIITCANIRAQGEKPLIQILSADPERVEIIRMKSGTDMLDGLNEAVRRNGIRNAVIVSGIGSVTDYHFHVVSDKNLPPAEEFPKASVPMDLLSVQGYILDGRVHAHIVLSDENSVVGGHLEKGTKALTFFIITLVVLPDSLKTEYLDNYKY